MLYLYGANTMTASAERANRDSAVQRHHTGRALRILIVEDDTMVAWDMALGLEGAGLAVCGTAVDSAEALALAAQTMPDIVLMDVTLKGSVDGIETASVLSKQVPGLPIIFVTGYGDPDTAARIRALDAAGYLLKPVDPDELARVVTQILRDSGATK